MTVLRVRGVVGFCVACVGLVVSLWVAAAPAGADVTDVLEQLGADIDGENADDRSGWSVSLSADGTTVAIGAPSNDDNGTNSGHVRVCAVVSSRSSPPSTPEDAVEAGNATATVTA